MLVFEDLVAAGFEVRSYKEAISVEDAVAVSGALADLHAALWRIRERLGFSGVAAEGVAGGSAAATGSSTTKVGPGKYERMLRESLNKYREGGEYKILLYLVDPVISDIVAAAADNDVEPQLLGHGDPWAHNVMLRRDAETGSVNGVAFVDFGNVRMVHPLEDLFCFLGTSSVRQAVLRRDTEIPGIYEARLCSQLPQDFNLKGCDAHHNLLSHRSVMHARASLLVYFLDHDVWWQKNSKGETEPGERQISAFASVAKLARQGSREQHTELLPPLDSSARLGGTERSCTKRK
jgi:hypothetical protein